MYLLLLRPMLPVRQSVTFGQHTKHHIRSIIITIIITIFIFYLILLEITILQ